MDKRKGCFMQKWFFMQACHGLQKKNLKHLKGVVSSLVKLPVFPELLCCFVSEQQFQELKLRIPM